jgi:hypothetical protein
MKSFATTSRSTASVLIGIWLAAAAFSQAWADPAEAADKAYEAAAKYSAKGYYMTPSKEGHGSTGVTYEFEVPVNRGLDYIFIVSGDRNCQAMQIWVEAEVTGNTIVKDTRRDRRGMAGVGWRSDYNGSVNVVVNFARVDGRCGWCALVGRRGTTAASVEGAVGTPATPAAPAASANPEKPEGASTKPVQPETPK